MIEIVATILQIVFYIALIILAIGFAGSFLKEVYTDLFYNESNKVKKD